MSPQHAIVASLNLLPLATHLHAVTLVKQIAAMIAKLRRILNVWWLVTRRFDIEGRKMSVKGLAIQGNALSS
jgi:hypothetical protein